MKRQPQRATAKTDDSQNWLPDDDLDEQDGDIDTLLKDGGRLAYCLRDHLLHTDAADFSDPAPSYLH